MSELWVKIYSIATCIIAIIAILGFIFSIKSSHNVSKALKIIKKGLIPITEPLILFDDFQWIVSSPDQNKVVSINNPPIGITFSYKNVSNIPVQIHESEAKYFYGKKELDDVTQSLGGSIDQGGKIILSSQDKIQGGTIQKDLFLKYLSKPKDIITPPHLEIHFNIIYSRINSEERYHYKSKNRILFNISQPGLKFRKPIHEEIKLIK